MNVIKYIEGYLRDAVFRNFPTKQTDLQAITVAFADPEHGDISSNAALALAKQVNQSPQDVATTIVQYLLDELHRIIESAQIAGPGFINIKLKDEIWRGAMVKAMHPKFGAAARGDDTRINLEFCSANPTGPIHIGHARGAVFGDALAKLMRYAGYEVATEYYVNDAGEQMKKLEASVELRMREEIECEKISEFPSDLYPGEYLIPVARKILKKSPNSDGTVLSEMMQLIREELAYAGIGFDSYTYESNLTEAVDEVLEFLTTNDLAYVGRLPPPKNSKGSVAAEDHLLFRSTQFGDETDRAVRKPDGTPTYFAGDIAYLRDKSRRGFDKAICILGADHSGYAKRLQGAASCAAPEMELELIFCQLVKLVEDGKEIMVSKRDGTYVTMTEVIDKVGVDALRFMLVYQKINSKLVFDLAKVVEQHKDNPVFYVQYAHARCCSLFRESGMECDAEALAAGDFNLLADNGEMALMKRLARFPNLIETAAKSREPHRLAHYLHDLATDFHAHWNRGMAEPELRFVVDDKDRTAARMGLVYAVRNVLRIGLGILGVSAPEEMR